MAEIPKFSHHVDHEQRRLVTTCTGALLFGDVAAHFAERVALKTMEYDQLVDLRNARIAYGTMEAEQLAASLLRKAGGRKLGRTAFLVADDVSFGMSRMFGALAAPQYMVNVFRAYDEAVEWLGWTKISPPRVTVRKIVTVA